MNKHIKSLYPWARNYDKGGPIKRQNLLAGMKTPEQVAAETMSVAENTKTQNSIDATEQRLQANKAQKERMQQQLSRQNAEIKPQNENPLHYASTNPLTQQIANFGYTNEQNPQTWYRPGYDYQQQYFSPETRKQAKNDMSNFTSLLFGTVFPEMLPFLAAYSGNELFNDDEQSKQDINTVINTAGFFAGGTHSVRDLFNRGKNIAKNTVEQVKFAKNFKPRQIAKEGDFVFEPFRGQDENLIGSVFYNKRDLQHKSGSKYGQKNILGRSLERVLRGGVKSDVYVEKSLMDQANLPDVKLNPLKKINRGFKSTFGKDANPKDYYKVSTEQLLTSKIPVNKKRQARLEAFKKQDFFTFKTDEGETIRATATKIENGDYRIIFKHEDGGSWDYIANAEYVKQKGLDGVIASVNDVENVVRSTPEEYLGKSLDNYLKNNPFSAKEKKVYDAINNQIVPQLKTKASKQTVPMFYNPKTAKSPGSVLRWGLYGLPATTALGTAFNTTALHIGQWRDYKGMQDRLQDTDYADFQELYYDLPQQDRDNISLIVSNYVNNPYQLENKQQFDALADVFEQQYGEKGLRMLDAYVKYQTTSYSDPIQIHPINATKSFVNDHIYQFSSDNDKSNNTFATGGPKKKVPTAEQLAAMANAQRNTELSGMSPMSSTYSGPTITPASTTNKAVPRSQTQAGVKTQQIVQTTQKPTQTTSTNVPEIKPAQLPHMYQSYYTNPLQEGWNNEAANLGYALGAGHPMTLNEMNNWTLNTMNLAGITAAPTLLGALESGYYFTTKRPVEGTLTALLTPVKPTINTIKNIRANLAFNRSELPQQLIDDVKNAVNNDAQRWVLRASQNGELIPSIEYVNKIHPKVEYKTGFKNWFKYSDTPILDLLGSAAFNQNRSTIVMNPLASMSHPQAYKGIIAHEARHSFQYPFMPQVSIPTKKYYGPNPRFELYGLIDAFEKPALKGKWRGSPEELLAEMANWKYQRGVLDIPYYQLDKQLQKKFIKDASSRFGFNELRTSMILDGLSKYGYFDAGGPIHIKPENRGKFTAAANRAGKSVQEYASQILANKDHYSTTLVKRANFAKNAKKFHH